MPPDLTVVICTHERDALLREALHAIETQDHPGTIETVVVYDRCTPDRSLERAAGPRPIRVVANERTPGLPGGRNTGVEHAGAPIVAFCDDDDLWAPDKARRQLQVLDDEPDTQTVITGMRVISGDHAVDRRVGASCITFDMLLADRIAAAHISAAMVRRDAFLGPIGRVNEEIPGGYAEDYDWTLRAARSHPIAVVDDPLVTVRWGLGSYFAERWTMIDQALGYLLDTYPEFARHPRGLGRILGQRAFARAAAHHTKPWPAIRATLRVNWREPRAYLATLVALRLLSPARVVRELNRRGRGI
jgi:glycosyltransferase involved in cell wall biosynthesis